MTQEQLVTIILALIASQGFWALITALLSNRSARMDLLKGLAHDRIIHVGKNYVERGWITYAEYEDFMKYLVEPYNRFGGNGLAERVSKEVESLPIRKVPPTYSAYTDRCDTDREDDND